MSDTARRRRDRLTILLYLQAGIFGIVVGALGPAMPLLRADLDLSRTIGGLHFTMVASGSVAAGFFADRLMAKWTRRRALWRGAGGVVLGAAGMGVAPHAGMSLTAAALVGLSGATMLAAVQSTLADQHPDNRAVFLTEGNLSTSIGTALPALLIGSSVAAGLGWRPVLFVPAALFAMVAVRYRTDPFPGTTSGRQRSIDGRLPTAYWLFWTAVISAVAAEWSIGAWAAGYMVEVGRASPSAAAALMIVFFGTMVAGRAVGSVLARSVSPTTMLAAGAAIALSGIVLLWSTEHLPTIVTGLGIAGLGTSVLFPMLLTMAIESAPSRTEVATARIAIAAGGAVVIAPLTLGAIADQAGIHLAFSLIPGLYGALVILGLLGRWAQRRAEEPSI